MNKLSNSKKIALTVGVLVGLAGIGILTVKILKKRAEKKSQKT